MQSITVHSNHFKSMNLYAFNLGMPCLWQPPKILMMMNSAFRRISGADKRKLLMRAKLIIIIMTTFLMQVSAAGMAQNISLKEKASPLSAVLQKIRIQSGYDFVFETSLVETAKKVNLNVEDVSLEEVLEMIFSSQDINYSLKDKFVVLTAKEKPFYKRIIDAFKTINIKGRVVDGNGISLQGAIVRVQGSSKATNTNKDGYFELNNIEEDALIVVSYIGFENRTLKANENLSLIRLRETLNKLDEVGVISTGYQKIQKDQLTGAASTMTEKDYQQRTAVTGNFLESLEGKVPGLVYNGQTGELTIRGVSTFDAVKQPLIVLDGFPTEIDLRTINPNDIVSVSVLRDAAAASIYGVRASNGVIVVETRRGRSGGPIFNIRSTYAVQNKPDFSYLKYAPASEFVQLQKDYFYIGKTSYSLFQLGIYKMDPVQEILFGLTQTSVSNPLLTQAQADAKLATLGSYDNLKEYEQLFYQHRQVKNINFDVSGGTEKSTYLLGLNYIGETPVNRRSENKQFILNMANTFKFSKAFSFDFKGTYTNNSDKSGNTPSYTDFFPYEHLADVNGSALAVALDPGRDYISRVITKTANKDLMAAGLYDQFYYPYRELNSNTNNNKGSSVRFQGRLNARMTNWLSMDIGGNYENQNILQEMLQLEDAYAVRVLVSNMALKDPVTGNAIFSNLPKGNILQRTNLRTNNYTLRGQLNLNHKFDDGEHDFSGILGVEQKKTLMRGYKTSFFGYDDQSLIPKPYNLNALNATSYPAFEELGFYTSFRSTDYFNDTETERRFMSYYGQGTYIFKGRYVATGSFRLDQSNLFGVDPKYKDKPFWSAGLNWRIGEEEFIKKIEWIDQLQFRAATGFNGNVPTSNNGPFLILKTGLNTTLNTPLSYNDVLSPENQSLRWETTRNYNLGFDFTLLKGRISGSADWYMKRTLDVFGQFDADPTSGFNQYNANTASIENKGFEFLISSVNVKQNKFQWRTQLTASFNHNEVLDVKATEYANSQLITSGTTPVKGLPIGALFSYNYGGLNEKGQPYVLDKKGNKKVLAFYGNSQVDVTKDDLIYNGTTTPKYVLGLNNQLSYGAFDLSFLIMYYGGHVMRVEQPNPNNIGFFDNNPLVGASNFWRKAGDENFTNIPGYVRASSSAPGYYQSYALYGYEYASQFVRKADYIRLRDVVLTYNAKAKFLQKLGLRNTQLRFQAQNAFRYTFSGNDIDPDAIDRITGVRSLENQPFYSLTFSTNF